MERFGGDGLPAVFVLDSKGAVVETVEEFEGADEFLVRLERVR